MRQHTQALIVTKQSSKLQKKTHGTTTEACGTRASVHNVSYFRKYFFCSAGTFLG